MHVYEYMYVNTMARLISSTTKYEILFQHNGAFLVTDCYVTNIPCRIPYLCCFITDYQDIYGNLNSGFKVETHRCLLSYILISLWLSSRLKKSFFVVQTLASNSKWPVLIYFSHTRIILQKQIRS